MQHKQVLSVSEDGPSVKVISSATSPKSDLDCLTKANVVLHGMYA